ncbi:hypothetical protein C8T65DRAFT_726174 [Cerioporus squamosus]|nr:hypothetical protein C8T65DRAFT_726174 [Cerioporus squamosus]
MQLSLEALRVLVTPIILLSASTASRVPSDVGTEPAQVYCNSGTRPSCHTASFVSNTKATLHYELGSGMAAQSNN